MSLRISDSNSERQVSIFLDSHFYPKFFPVYKRVDDKETQLQGIDTIIQISENEQFLCDEKSAIHYINKALPTFAFELNFRLNNSQIVDGWFLSSEKRTEYYLLTWIWAKKDKGFIAEDITKLEVIFINRNRLIKELEKEGISSELIKRKSLEIRKNNLNGAIEKSFLKPYYFYLTTHLQENPLNLIIKKDFLIKHSHLHKTIIV